ncbi:MAG: lysine--tRNA ligase, partial [Proteobacteria bacterium]
MADAPNANQSAASLDSLIEVRKAKAERVRAREANPFANDLAPDAGWPARIDIAAARALADAGRVEGGKYAEEAVKTAAGADERHVAGRIVALRSTGGLSFLRLRDGTGELQLLVSEATLGELYARLDELDVGDIVHARGPLIASKRGELSIDTHEVRLLTKALRPLPEKWHGLTDVEIRYRQRYVDLIANPDVAQVFRARTHIVRSVRRVLDEASFLEVETPTMHTVLGGAAAKPFETHHNTLDLGLFMRIAPELYLKRLLVGGFDRVYEIGRSYRNEGISTRHNPEFTMLEFYQAYATYTELMAFTEVLLRGVDDALQAAMPEAHAKWKAERPFTLGEPFARVPMNEAVQAAAAKTGIESWGALYPVTNTQEDAFLTHLTDVFSNRPEEMKVWSKSSPRAKAIDWGNFRRGYLKCQTQGDRLFSAYEYLSEPFLADDYR